MIELNTNYYSSEFRLGIVGGGQLGKMLLTETQRLDISTKILDPAANAPSRIGSKEFEQGSLQDYDTVYNFGKDCDVITIEIENVNTEALAQLEKEGKKVFPQAALIDLIKNKITQKEFYQAQGIPTADFKTYTSKAELIKSCEEFTLTYPFVWKVATGGFDGRGVSIIRSKEDLNDLPDAPCLSEDLVPFEKEIAVIVARSEKGEVKAFPTVEMDFHPSANLVEFVFSPGNLKAEISDAAQILAKHIAEKLGLVGILAVEMFLTQSGELLINEVAPRVHNSGHLSIEGNICSQFEQHLRAILNLPLGDTQTIQPAVMVNLVGEENYSGPVKYQGIEELMAMSGVYVHLYGKAETRPFRKMGHVTIIAPNLEEARSKAKIVKESIKVISI
ncbi:MAG: 5-(carboxyamino)imidazole ribonucleotide synthase [Bacteroidetes bacterium]|nr:MAG: 5-(carboxyamino)imidazole ribonucleotide synthase [Bacteroidota bacterium]